MDHPKSWLRYIEADKIEDRTLALDGMKVRNNADEKLGAVDGLIVDSDSGRTYYIVVDGKNGAVGDYTLTVDSCGACNAASSPALA